MDAEREGPSVGDSPFDAFGNEFRFALHIRLHIPVLASLLHRLQGAHAPINLIASALIENKFSRAFVGASKEVANHHRAGSCCKGLGDVAGEFNSPIGNDRQVMLCRHFSHIQDGRKLWNAHACDDPRGADGSRSHSDLHPIHSRLDQIEHPLLGRDVPRNQLTMRIILFGVTNRLKYILGMTIGRINDQNINPRLYEGFCSGLPVFSGA